ncbi:hypothetical protein CYMTET_11988 [Cymbomonas tetramitiformis]|uniref:SAM domain-containing protein n=1 Tax=Cymbomonas tetramitiformis TaxID=36881 RepID=A0AAE0GLL4_9CHLO|nr:hypothetical protein CYMTET_11988 [Cymbomonas tetramitiformis]
MWCTRTCIRTLILYVVVGGAAVATIVYVGVAGSTRRTHLRSTVRIGQPQAGLPVAFEVDVPISKVEDIWDVAIIFDPRMKTFRAWQEGDRPPNPLLPAPHGPKPHLVLDLPYALKVNFRIGSAVHTFYSTRACADSGQHFLLVDQSQQQLLPKEYFEEENKELTAKSAEAAAAPSPASMETVQSAEAAPEASPKPVESTNSADPSTEVAESASSGKTISEFTVDEICTWVEGLGMESEPWRQNTITGKDMEHLSDEDMQGDLGLTRLQVKKIRRELGQ